MAYFHSPRTVTDGLVFFYDTVNSKSYAGEPTTNLLNNSILGLGSGASLGSDGTGTYIQLADTTTGYSRFQLPSIPVSSNDIYTWSFELMSPVDITTGYYFDTNEYSDQFPSSNDLSRVGAVHRVPSTMPAWKWQEFSLTVTMKPDLTGAYTYDFFNMFYPTFQNKKIYYRNMQFEFKDHPTQYVGQGGSRSVTQGLLDLTGNLTIDLSNVSFDSNAQITFDGSDDWMNAAVTLNAGNFTYETVMKQFGSTSYQIFAAGTGVPSNGGTNIQAFVNSSGGLVNLYAPVGGSGWQYGTYDNTGNFTATSNVNYHIAVVNLDTTWKIYVNGDLVGDIDSFVPTVGNRVGIARSAMQAANNSSLQVSLVKIYDKALTASEVQQNYNAVKSRFGI